MSRIINKVLPVSYIKDDDGCLIVNIDIRRPAPDTIGYYSNKLEQMNKKNRARARLQKKLLDKTK